ncbi:hypothetical protein U3516DRAFT_767768 [Neocallimastix sp. 'constans']
MIKTNYIIGNITYTYLGALTITDDGLSKNRPDLIRFTQGNSNISVKFYNLKPYCQVSLVYKSINQQRLLKIILALIITCIGTAMINVLIQAMVMLVQQIDVFYNLELDNVTQQAHITTDDCSEVIYKLFRELA